MGRARCNVVARFAVSVLGMGTVLLPSVAVALDGFETRITDPATLTLNQYRQQFATDRNTVVYAGVATGSPRSQVFRYEIVTRASTLLSPSDERQYSPDISGSRAVFLETVPTPSGLVPSQVVLDDVGTSARTVLRTDIDLYGVGISGDRVVIEHCNAHCVVILMDVATSPPSWLTTIDAGPTEPHARIDGNRVVFVSEREHGLVVYDIPGATGRVFASSSATDPDVYGDLAVYAQRNASGHFEVVVYDLATDGIVRRIGGAIGDAMRPRIDGTRVVWEDTRSGSSQIWTMDLADGVEESVSPPGNDARFPAVDANHILYQDARGGTAAAIYLFTIVSPGDVLRSFDDAVTDGTLTGNGPALSAASRLDAVRNMLATAGALIASGDIQTACSQLADASARMDGEPRPPDFATGSAAARLTRMIAELEVSIGCN